MPSHSLSSMLSQSKLLPYALHGLAAIAILVIGWLLARILSRVISRIVARRLDQTVGSFANQLVFYITMLLVFIAVLSQLGVQTTSLIAILGGLSVAIGLSLRASLSNFAAGILLVVFKPIRIGDRISIDGNQGIVTDLQLLFTYLSDEEHNQITLPNNMLITKVITRYQAADSL